MEKGRGPRDLLVWKQAMDLTVAVYHLSGTLPKCEEFSLKAQLRRCAVSIPSNIAEGSGRGTRRDFQSFCRIAKGSTRELETQVEIALRIGYFTEEQAAELQDQVASVAKLLNRLIESLEADSVR